MLLPRDVSVWTDLRRPRNGRLLLAVGGTIAPHGNPVSLRRMSQNKCALGFHGHLIPLRRLSARESVALTGVASHLMVRDVPASYRCHAAEILEWINACSRWRGMFIEASLPIMPDSLDIFWSVNTTLEESRYVLAFHW